MFAPFQETELCRVLAPNGIFLRAYPLEGHLLGLKRLIFAQPYENKPVNLDLPGLSLLESREIGGEITFTSQEDIRNLFMMTPYFYKTDRADRRDPAERCADTSGKIQPNYSKRKKTSLYGKSFSFQAEPNGRAQRSRPGHSMCNGKVFEASGIRVETRSLKPPPMYPAAGKL